jgi:TonB family protein
MFQQFETRAAEKGSRKRKAVSLGAALAVYVAVGLAILYAATGEHRRPSREKPLEVTFARAALRARAAPVKPKPPPPAAMKKVSARRLKRLARRPALLPPKALPKEPPKETDPASLRPAGMTLADLEERGDVVGSVIEESPPPRPDVETPTRPRARPRRADPRPVAAKPPIYLPENATPPRPLETNPMPRYPEARLRSGSTDTVILKVVIDEAGTVEVLEVLRGAPDFVSAVREVLPRWRFTPAVFEGERLRVFKILEIPFRIRG